MNYTDLQSENQHLTQELVQLENHAQNLETILNQITSAKAFIIWQQINNFKKKSKDFIKKMCGFSNQKNYGCFFYPDKRIKNKITEKVSVIIPAHNAGKGFEKNLLSIKKQKNITDIEIIVVDNYSCDQTVRIALSLGCKIMKIKNFSHSRSRNLGTSGAKGVYLFFTVQDAYFADLYAFCKLINFIKNNNLAAASGYQIPYRNADNFAKWQFKRHYDFMNPKKQNIIYKGDIISHKLHLLNFLEKRKLMSIDDVFSCFKADIFKKYLFSERIDFAEDAELALRLLRDKYNIGSAVFSKVYHSHNRNFIYHFKRTFSDLSSLNLILKETLHRVNAPFIESIYMIFNLIILLELNLNNKTNLWDSIKYQMLQAPTIKQYQQSSFYRYFYKILKEMNFHHKKCFNEYFFNVFKNEIDTHWDSYYKYLKANNYQPQKDDLLKIAAVVLAGYLGEIASKISDQHIEETLNFLTYSI